MRSTRAAWLLPAGPLPHLLVLCALSMPRWAYAYGERAPVDIELLRPAHASVALVTAFPAHAYELLGEAVNLDWPERPIDTLEGWRMVNVAARASLAGGATLAAYSAAKAAVLRLTESLAAEVKAKGIRVNAVLPGTIDTPQNRKESPNADYSRWVDPAALADVIIFLASDAARAIHGAGIPVYGLG